MEETIKSKTKLELDSFYTESEILQMNVRSLNNRGMDYLVFEKDDTVYFFEKLKEVNLFRLFSITTKQSYYLS